MDRLRAYEVFVAVVKRGSFTRAADALDTSPANVTRYIVELEGHLGTRLLNRTSRRLSLTSGGGRFTSAAWPYSMTSPRRRGWYRRLPPSREGGCALTRQSALACCSLRRYGRSLCGGIPRWSWMYR